MVSIRMNWEERRKQRRRELAAAELEALYEFFHHRVDRDPLRKQTSSELELAMARFVECASVVQRLADGYALTDEQWVERAANLFEEMIVAYCDDPYSVKTKT